FLQLRICCGQLRIELQASVPYKFQIALMLIELLKDWRKHFVFRYLSQCSVSVLPTPRQLIKSFSEHTKTCRNLSGSLPNPPGDLDVFSLREAMNKLNVF